MEKEKSQKWEDRIFDVVFVGGGIFLLFNLKVIFEGIKKLHADTVRTFCGFVMPLLALIAYKNWHLPLLGELGFSRGVLHKIYMAGTFQNFFWLFILTSAIVLWAIGIGAYCKKRRIEKALSRVLLKNAYGDGPKVVARFDESIYREIIRLKAPGIGAERMESQKSAIESALGRQVEFVRPHRDRTYTDLVLVKRELPTKIPYESLRILERGAQFRIGSSKEGQHLGDISSFPHMLIAGTTGGGKSVFFKQMLLGILESTSNTQLYLIDLKCGLEIRPFAELPNVKMTKTIPEAVELLKEVKREMEQRFQWLEKSKKLRIEPNFDPFDRIVVGIDEASVLYTGLSKNDEDYELLQEARFLTEHIAKLSRAAAIHLILATQKVTKETIDTRIQENVSAKMCFRLNTIEGSVRVLGHGGAAELPAIPGRGIFQSGNWELTVQVPYLDSKSLEERIDALKTEMESGERKLRQSMLMLEKPSTPFWMNGEKESERRNEA